MNNILLKEELKHLSKKAFDFQMECGKLRAKIPMLKPEEYKSIENLYIHSREALMELQNDLEELTEELCQTDY